MKAKNQRAENGLSMSQFNNNLYTNMTELRPSINKILARVRAWKEVSWQRKELLGLSDSQLKDIGISRVDAQREADRHFWDLGQTRDSSLRNRQNSGLARSCNEATELCNS